MRHCGKEKPTRIVPKQYADIEKIVVEAPPAGGALFKNQIMKKIKLIPIVLMLALGCTAMAQNECPKYEMGSNWSMGGELIYGQHYATGSFGDFHKATGLGMGFALEKKFNHVWDVRLHLAIPVMNAKGLDKYGKATLDAKFSLNNALMGYKPGRRFSVYVMAGVGVAPVYQTISEVAFVWQYGPGVSYTFGKKESGRVYLEYVMDNITDFSQFDIYKHSHGALVLGVMYNFGLSERDRQKKTE